MRLRASLPCFVLVGVLTACATPPPSGPNVMVLPGRGASFERFADDDAGCRDWASGHVGIAPQTAARESAAEGAIAGAAIGAAAGAAIGAASGEAGSGAAIGAGSGLLLGSAVGGSQAAWSRSSIQQQYDAAYMQCMYGHGHQIPMARGSVPYSSNVPPPPDYDDRPRNDVPAPPRGAPPPPPPDWE